MTPPVPDGPDTELAAIVADLDDLHTEAASVAMRSEGSVTAAAEEVRDDVASIRDRLRAVLARPAAGRDLTDVEDGPTAVELLDDNERLGVALVDIGIAVGLPRPSATVRWGAPEILARLATLNSELGVPPRATARIAQARADQAEGYGSTTSTVEGLLRELDRRGGELVRLRAACARPAVARTDGQPPADPVQITRDPARVTAQVVQAVWDEEGPEGVADWIRDMTAAPADDTAAAPAPWMVESRDERVDRLTRHVENVADCAGIEIEVREAGPLTGPAPLRRLVRALEGAGMLHDDPADDTAAPDGMDLDTFASLPLAQAQAWIKARQEECRRERAAECDANGQHLVLEADTSHCGYCGRLYADIAGGSSPASTDGGEG